MLLPYLCKHIYQKSAAVLCNFNTSLGLSGVYIEYVSTYLFLPHRHERYSEHYIMVLLQVNCRSICNKVLEYWNLIDAYNPDVVIGTESWLSEEIVSDEK